MSFTFIPGENISKEEENVWYYGGYAGADRVMVGHLVATSERLIFYEKRPTGARTLETIGVAFEVPVDSVVAAKFEKRFRGGSSRPRWDDLTIYNEIVKGSRAVNLPPSLLNGKDQYNALIIAVERGSRLQSLTFEVRDPMGWLKVLGRLKRPADREEDDAD